jgi:hypothetical protein
MKDLLSRLSSKTKEAATDAAQAISEATGSVVDTTKSILDAGLDQDGDGKFDQADFKILKDR